MSQDGSMIVAPIARREDLCLLRGRSGYVDDIDLPDVAHMAVVRSTLPHANILSIDTAAALALPGVIGVFTAADIAEINSPWGGNAVERASGPSSDGGDRNILQRSLKPVIRRTLPTDKVRYVGEPVAFVVAESRYLAEDACELVYVDYEPLPSSGTWQRSLSFGTAIHDGIEDNIAAHVTQGSGDIENALRTAPNVLHEVFTVARGGGHSMEGRVTAAKYDRSLGSYIVWDATQSPHGARRHLAACYGVSEDIIRVIAPPDVGGGFGPKMGRYPEETVVPWLSKKVGRPVKFVEDRLESFMTSSQEHPMEHVLDVAFDDDGVLIGLKDVFYTDFGAYPGSMNVATIAATTVPGPYRIPNLHLEFTAVFTNKVPQGAVRGAGRPQGVFVMERMIDRIAQHLDLDPAEVRFRNLIRSDEMPFAVGITFRDGNALTYDSGDYPTLLQTGLDLIDYDARRSQQIAARAEGKYQGIGMSVAVEGVGIGPFEGATVRVESNGRVTAIMGAPPQGQGYQTTYAQIVADFLGVQMDDVDVVTGDTAQMPFSTGTFASRVMANAGPAMASAAKDVREKLMKSAAAMLEAAPEDLEIRGRQIFVRGMQEGGVPIADVARMSNVGMGGISLPKEAVPGLTSTSYFNPERAGYSSSVQICVVEVDVGTGEVKFLDWVCGHDCGKVINPLLVEGQVLGGLAHGLSNSLFEEMIYSDEGIPLTTSYLEYPIPSGVDMPRIRLYHQETLSPLNPLGAKGAGEAGT